jgi:drug/metabolite transporter (DMT)-like permease
MTFLIGICFYGLLFFGAHRTSPVNVALLSLLEIPFSMLLLRAHQSERLTLPQSCGSALMLVGAAWLLSPWNLRLNIGDMVIVGACLLPPLGNYFIKKARRLVASEIIMLVRSMVSGAALCAAALLLEGAPTYQDLAGGLPCVLLSGVLLMGISKILWTEAVHRIPIPKAVSSLALAPPLTVIISVALLGTYPTPTQIAALLPVCIGMLLIASRTPGENVKTIASIDEF